MKIARFSVDGDPAYGILDEEVEELVVLQGDPMFAGFQPTGERVALGSARLLAPVIPRSKVVGVGLNYAGHAEVAKLSGGGPMIFLKPNTAVVGPGDAIQLPESAGRVVHEGELAVVIGRIAKQVPEERAAEVIFGYSIANDVTALDQILDEGQWTRAKGYDTFCPLGPYIETELDPSAVEIRTFVDGEPRRQGSTSEMLTSVPSLIAAVSDVWTLLPGDVILTGTPAGPGEIAAGQRVDITIDGIGTLSNPVRARA